MTLWRSVSKNAYSIHYYCCYIRYNIHIKVNITLTHVFEYEVNVFVVIGPMDVEQSDNVWVIAKMLQEHDFTKSSLGVGLIPESVYTHTQKKDTDRELSIKI